MRPVLALAAALSCVLALACSDPRPATDAGGDPASPADVSSDLGWDREAPDQDPTDAPPGDGGGSDGGADAADLPPKVVCEPGARVEAEVGASGAELELCGARLSVAAAALPTGGLVGLEVVAPPADPPFEQAFVGQAFRFIGPDDVDFAAVLLLPDDPAQKGYRQLAVLDEVAGAWFSFEACPIDGGLRDSFAVPGTYVILRDTYVFPDGPTGLGEGTVQTVFEGETIDWTFDDGYVVHDQGQDGRRSISVIARRDVAPDGLQQLDLKLVEGDAGVVNLLQVTLLDTTDPSGGWSYLEPVHGPANQVSLAVNGEGRTQGSFTVDLHQGDTLTETMTATLDVLSERFRFPPEGVCKGR